MTLPGPIIISRSAPPPRSSPTDTGVWFATGITEKGDHTKPDYVTSLTDFTTKFGGRLSTSYLYDAIETFFREGGGKAYIGRVVGPTPVKATCNVFDQAGSSAPADVALVCNAKSVGTWGNSLNIVIDDTSSVGAIPAGYFRITITDDVLGTLEVSTDLADRAAAVAWSATSKYVDLVLGASAEDPRDATATSLAGGTDDSASAVDAQWQNALNLFPFDLGPGQVSAPGRTTDTAHTQLLTHAAACNRLALLDGADTATAATLVASAAVCRALATARYGAMFAPWAVVPGITGGTTRTVPYSAVQAGLIARADGLGLSPNEPAAGANGQSQFCVGLSQSGWVDSDRELLNNGGVNVAKLVYGGVRTYGYRTFVDPVTSPSWLMLSNARLNMAVAAQGAVVMESFEFSQIDGKRKIFGKLAGQLTGVLVPFYEKGSLYGDTPEEAFNVDTGAQVNTELTIADREIRAVITMRMSPFGEVCTLELVKVATTEAVA